MNDPKTPRDWLLHRHESATPQLSALRREALPPAALTWRDFLRELFQPQQTLWKSLTAIWLGLLAFHLFGPPSAQPNLNFAKTPEMLALWSLQLTPNDTLAQILKGP
jgi:hypothetical protein